MGQAILSEHEKEDIHKVDVNKKLLRIVKRTRYKKIESPNIDVLNKKGKKEEEKRWRSYHYFFPIKLIIK